MLARVLVVTLCLCLSVTSWCSIEMVDGASWFLACRHCVRKGIQVSTKISVLSSGTLSQTPDLENVASACGSSKRVIINLAR